MSDIRRPEASQSGSDRGAGRPAGLSTSVRRYDGGSRVPGWDDAADGVALVEWPDRLGHLAPADALHVDLTYDGEARHAALHGWPGRLEHLR